MAAAVTGEAARLRIYTERGVTVAPLVFCADFVGATTVIDEARGTATAEMNGHRIVYTVKPPEPVVDEVGHVWSFSPGKTVAVVDGKPVEIPVGCVIRDGVVLVPVASLARSLGFPLRWDSAYMQVVIADVRSGEDLRLSPGYCSHTEQWWPEPHILAQCSAVKHLEDWVKAGGAIDALDYMGWTALHRMADDGKAKMAAELVRLGATVDARDGHQRTPLMLGVSSYAVMDVLLTAKADPRARDDVGAMPIHYAAARGDVARFVRLGCTINDTDNRGRTPLFYTNSAGGVHVLLKMGADKEAADNDGRRPPSVAGVDEYGMTALHLAAMEGRPNAVCESVAYYVAIDAVDNRGRTALHYAAEQGHAATVRWLLGRGARRDIKDKDGKLALDLARDQGRADTVKALTK